jgi:predicted branched-subunit amino acid permease
MRLSRHPARRAAVLRGARAVSPSLPAMAVWGVVTGVAMMKLGLALGPALGMTFIVYSGTSQLTVLPLMAGSTAVLTMVLAAALAGLRFVVYSAVLSRHLARVPLALRLGTCFLTIDGPLAVLTQAHSLANAQAPSRRPLVQRVALLNAANLLTALVWCASSVLGIALAAWLPLGAELSYLAVLALLAFTVPMLLGRPAWAAAAASMTVTLLAAPWPHKLGTFAAVLAGVAAALWASPRPHKD